MRTLVEEVRDDLQGIENDDVLSHRIAIDDITWYVD
jgi:hypothetical protein